MASLKKKKSKSLIDLYKYDPVKHNLEVCFCYQKFTYMGVPDSIYWKMASAEIPDLVFMTEVFNKYPVFIETFPIPVKRKRKKPKKDRQTDNRLP